MLHLKPVKDFERVVTFLTSNESGKFSCYKVPVKFLYDLWQGSFSARVQLTKGKINHISSVTMYGVKLCLHSIFVSLLTSCFAGGFRLGKCRKPEPPANAVLSATSQLQLYRNQGFAVSFQVRFQCKVGYRQQGRLTSICSPDGMWVPEPRKSGRCLTDRRRSQNCGNGQFRCQDDGICIDSILRCDCNLDCNDGSDEENCLNARKIIVGREERLKTSGAVTSPGYPLKYPRNFRCTYSFITSENYVFRVDFEEIALRIGNGGKCHDYVKISGIRPVSLSSTDEVIKSKSDLNTRLVICGRENPSTVYSNSSAFDVEAKFHGGAQSNDMVRGFSLIWRIVPRDSVQFLGSTRKKKNFKKNFKTKFIAENYVTVIVPIIISALVPITLILFMCRRKHFQNDEKQPREVTDESSVQKSQIDIYNQMMPAASTNSSANNAVNYTMADGSIFQVIEPSRPRPSYMEEAHQMYEYGLPRPTYVLYSDLCKQKAITCPVRHNGADFPLRDFSSCHQSQSTCYCDTRETSNTLCQKYQGYLEKRRVVDNDFINQRLVAKQGLSREAKKYFQRETQEVGTNQPCCCNSINDEDLYAHANGTPVFGYRGFNRRKTGCVPALLNSERLADGVSLVAKQRSSCLQNCSETDTGTTKSSLL